MPPTLCDFSYRDSNNIMIYDLHLVTSSSRIFTAIFPKISMLNHSCDPNIRNTFDGPYLSIYATRDIASNEEIFNCYGPNYKLMSTLDRQSSLKQQYCFDCKCNKCMSLIMDQTYAKYYEYVCSNENCRAPIKFNFPDHQWWNHLHNGPGMEAITPAFCCIKCQQSLLLNPQSLKEFFESTATENDVDFRYYRRKAMTERAIAYYMNVSKCLSKHHELKAIMAQYLLKYQMHGMLQFCFSYLKRKKQSLSVSFFLSSADKEELFTKLAYIAMENYVITRERFGSFSLEVVMSITYALNILKLAKELETETSKHTEDIAKIRKVFDTTKMEKSIIILSKSMQTIFKNAFDELNQTESGKVNDRLTQLNLSNPDWDTSITID